MKMMKNFNIEILAPVGNEEMLVSAVRSGADAVYLGSENFNARRNAENFSLEALESAVKYAKINGVKVYLTLNTAVTNEEIEKAVNVAEESLKIGIDGVIVADLGLARRLHKELPDLPLHASTQMSVHSVSALPTLKEMGIKRVVLSREMDKNSIANFVKKASDLGIETEVFVHGALCMSVSGQCLLSSVIGGRSGNRGLCAGPCRLPFKNGSSEYALSLKDLSLLNYVRELKGMGVASLKIEGRMKRPEYVAAAVSAFKKAVNDEDITFYAEKLSGVFSRSGFTDGYYKNNLGDDMFGIRTKDDVIASTEVMNEIHSLYRNELQRVPISIKAEIEAGKRAKLTLSDGKNTVFVEGDIPEAAKSRELEKETVENAVTKLGGTPYFAEKTEVILENGLFLSSSRLNELRRNAVLELNKARNVKPNVKRANFKENFGTSFGEEPKLFCRFSEREQIPKNLGGVSLVVLPLFADFNDLSFNENIEIAAELPRGILNEEIIAKRLKEIKKLGIKTAFCGTLAAKQLAEDSGFEVFSDIGFNTFNNETVKALENMGANGVILSPELSVSGVKNIKSNVPRGIFAYGRLPLMLTRNCPVKNTGCESCNKDRTLTDRTGTKFPVRCVNGFSEIFNSKPHYLADKMTDFKGIHFMYLYFTFENSQEAEDIIEAYRKGKKPTGEFTRGLYYREVY